MIIERDGVKYQAVMNFMIGRMCWTFWRVWLGGEVVNQFWTWDPGDPPPTRVPANDTGERMAA